MKNRLFSQIVTNLSLLAAFAMMINSANANETVFQARLKLLVPIEITETSSLTFAEAIAGKAQTLTVKPEENGAAKFAAAGDPQTSITANIVENSVILKKGNGDSESKLIEVNGFTTGGDLSNSGSGTFDIDGKLADIRIGANAHIGANNEPGNYVANATFRMVYN